jgi:hypothetical protein
LSLGKADGPAVRGEIRDTAIEAIPDREIDGTETSITLDAEDPFGSDGKLGFVELAAFRAVLSRIVGDEEQPPDQLV